MRLGASFDGPTVGPTVGPMCRSGPAAGDGGRSSTGPAIVPGKPDESLLVEAVRYADPAVQMPPKGKLPDESIAALVDWVTRGAPDPRSDAPKAKPNGRTIDLEAEGKHWAYQPLAKADPLPPAIDSSAGSPAARS